MALDGKDGRKHEVWHGKIVTMPPAGAEHEDVIARLLTAIGSHVYANKLGRVYDGQTSFRLGLEFCLSPDLSFVSHARLALILPSKDKLFHGAPDLAVEVLSPSDSITRTEEKLARLLTHGTRLAWLISPRQGWVRVYRQPGRFELLRPGRFLTGHAVLPGFRYAVARLFINTFPE
ncbi:MAG: Uma2 family endonuclease [Roseiflexus sp.]|nr:Uma2 family endonuclease [Roseiflexus sp.]